MGEEPRLAYAAPVLRRGVVGELFWAIADPVLIVRDGAIEAWNPAAASKFGLSDTEVVAKDFDLQRVFGDDTDRFRALVASGENGSLSCEPAHQVLLDVGVNRLEGSGPDRALVVLRDVTKEQRYLRTLARLNDVARDVLSAGSIDVVLQKIVDEAKEITGAAFSALLILKEGSDTEVARFVYNAPRNLFPSRLPRAVGLLAVPIQSRTVANLDDIRGHPAGVGIPVTHHPPIGPLLAVPMIVGDVVIGELAVANEPGQRSFDEVEEGVLTELGLQAAEAVRIAEARMLREEHDRARQTMIDVLRHDIATPLAVARGCVGHLRENSETLSPEQRVEIFEALDRSIAGLERLSSNLRSDARLENPSLYEEFRPIEVVRLLDEVRGDIIDFASQRGVELAIETDENLPRTFDGSQLLVRQAIENLLTNAVKHSKKGSTVTLTTRTEGASIRFDVRDSGPGIPSEDQESLFDRFTTSRSPLTGLAGLGIGLSIVRRVADSHGGTVGVASQPGHGSTFWVAFPVSSDP